VSARDRHRCFLASLRLLCCDGIAVSFVASPAPEDEEVEEEEEEEE
jgi:hypothetical protein